MRTTQDNVKIILASASPRRRDLLRILGKDFTVEAPEIDESRLPEESPRTYAERLAVEKSRAVSNPGEAIVIAADTIVVQDGNILGKPTDHADAYRMLTGLSGRSHEVITGVCLRSQDRVTVFSVSTEVVFRAVQEAEIRDYIESGCPMDKAGAYAIQGGAAHMVRAINGSYTNVVGLPLCELHEALNSF